MNALKYILLGMQYLPAVLQAVMAVEHASNQNESGIKLAGATKKALVLSSAKTSPSPAEPTQPSHIELVSNLIEQIVGTLNAAGVFTHAK